MSPYRRIGTQLTFTDQEKIEGVIKAGLELMSGSFPHSAILNKIQLEVGHEGINNLDDSDLETGTCLLESVTPPRS